MQWEEPAPRYAPGGARKYLTDEVIEELRANPGRWAVIAEGPKSQASGLKSAQQRAAAVNHWNLEFAVRTSGGRSKLYARWREEPA